MDFCFIEVKCIFVKLINIFVQVLLDCECCILCVCCIWFFDQIVGDLFIDMQECGVLQQVGIYVDELFELYFFGNMVQICLVGVLMGIVYWFCVCLFDLVFSFSVCEYCVLGCV